MIRHRCSCGAFTSPGLSCRRCGNRHTESYFDYYNLYQPGGMGDVNYNTDFQFIGSPIPDIPDLPPDVPLDWGSLMPDMGMAGRIAGAIGIGIIDAVVPGFGVIADIANIIADAGAAGEGAA